MRTLISVAAALVGVLVLFLIYVGLQPADFEITRSRTIAAPPAVVYDHLDDFKTWLTWNPWQGLDPAQTVEIGGPETGVGAWYTWAGNEDVGRGRMEVVEAVPGEKITWDLAFIEPFEAKNLTSITLAPADGGTQVTWSMTGANGFMGKLMSQFIDMDAMVGADFERGLSSLDALAVEAAKVPEPTADTDAGESMQEAAAENAAPAEGDAG